MTFTICMVFFCSIESLIKNTTVPVLLDFSISVENCWKHRKTPSSKYQRRLCLDLWNAVWKPRPRIHHQRPWRPSFSSISGHRGLLKVCVVVSYAAHKNGTWPECVRRLKSVTWPGTFFGEEEGLLKFSVFTLSRVDAFDGMPNGVSYKTVRRRFVGGEGYNPV